MADFESFRKSFKGDIIGTSDPGYEEAIKRWANNASRRAKYVAYVKDAQDVVAAIKWAKASHTPLAVRGGGHSPAGTSSVENGLVIDLSRYLNTVKIDATKKLGYVGGGALWEHVDNAASEHGLAAVGGTVNHTGVGGLSTGGGFGYLTGEHGLVIDNVVQVTIVTGNGVVLTANSKENQDLYFGVRGGGSNFGIVTEFVYKLHEQKNKVYGGMMIFGMDKLEAVADALNKWWPKVTPKEAINVALARLPPAHEPAIILVTFYNGSKEEALKHSKPFDDIGPLMDMRQEMEYKQMNTVLNELSAFGRCCYMRGNLMDGAAKGEIPEMISRTVADKLFETTKDGRFNAFLMFEFLPNTKIHSVSPDETPYCRTLPGNALAVVQWIDNTPENAREGLDLVLELANLVKGDGEAYGNYNVDPDGIPLPPAVAASLAKIGRAKALFRDHYPKMQKIKAKHDPDVIFNRWYAIAPTVAA